MTLSEHDDLTFSMTNHTPRDEAITARLEEVRVPAREFGHVVLDLCPPGRARAVALIRLEEALQWAIKAIILNQDAIPPPAPPTGTGPSPKMP